jgi:class 3 adenylate cyclase
VYTQKDRLDDKKEFPMPIFMDRHYTENATREGIANAHDKDLEIQEKHNCKFITYWFDDDRHTGFCLVDAPNKEALQDAHNEAHGGIPHEIIEVDPTIVEAFLGRVKDPEPVASSPGKAQPDSAFRTIMFTDLKDSTLMSTIFGDEKALHLLRVHNALTRNALREFKGNEVKHTGDGIMASFDSVSNAVACTIVIQRSFDEYNQEHSDEPLFVRIGLSAGEPIEESGDLYGKAVNLAARLCAHAEPGNILVAELVRNLCHDEVYSFDNIGEVTPKGFTKPITAFEVKWQI